ncbi:hypothetical protein ACFC3F_06725 [Microbacterium sp. NPDC055910]|uniref:hypothetical protein n=1 Tax=Microbacterium sp. NPDC055910 TaxID=3345659 RepID=UPI0035DE7434
MSQQRRGRTSAVTVALCLAFALAGCSAGTAPAASTTPSPTATATPTPTPTPTPSPEPLALTCDTIITPEAVADFAAFGWTGQERPNGPWTVGSEPFEDGLACQWMLDHSVATDNFSWFGWAPMDAAQAAAVTSSLTDSGEFLSDETPDGVYLTIDPSLAMVTDENGYGITYLLADGWIAGAGTRAELMLVRVPEGWAPEGD